MKISNQNIRNIIRWSLVLPVAIVVADVVFALSSHLPVELFSGYSALIYPIALLGIYAYVGMPIFHFNADSEVLHIKSHLAFSEVFGKELYVAKKNIVKFEIDRKRLRKKLKVHYLKDGREFSQTFSITLLGNKKIENLAKEVKLIHAEVGHQSNYHLFI